MKKISHKIIDEYIKYTEANPNEVSDEIHLLIKNIVKPTLCRDDIFFDVVKYDKCIKFCERWYYSLGLYQKFLYAFVFMFSKSNGDIVIFRDIFQLMGRGNGKDGMVMPLASFLLTPMYGVKNYHIDIVATSEDQAINSFNVVYNMLEDNKSIMRKMFYWNKTMIINKITKSRLRYNTSSAKTKDGKQTGMIIFNELHAYENHDQLNVFKSGLGKIKHARMWTITTNGHIRQGPLDEKLDHSIQVLNGEDNFTGLFPFIARINSDDIVHLPMKKFLKTKELTDIDTTVWKQANPSLDFMPILREEIIQHYFDMLKTPSAKSEFFAKRMNQPISDQEIVVTSWENILRASYEDILLKTPRITPELDGRVAVIGIDFASINDFVSVGLLFKVENEYIWRQRTWVTTRGRFFESINFPFDSLGSQGYEDYVILDTPTISEIEVVKWIVDEMSKHQIKKILLDNYRYQLLRKAFEEYGISIEEKGNPDGLVRMIRYPQSIYAIVAPYVERLFVQGNINIGDSAIMRWAINNTGMKQLSNGNHTYYKIEEKLRKNDPFMAMIHAFSVHEMLEEEVIYMYM